MSTKDESLVIYAGDTYRNRHWSGVPGGHNKGKFVKLAKKCVKCGSNQNLDIHHKSGNRSDLKSGKGLQVLCRSCHRKLHQGNPDAKGDLIGSSIILTCEGRIVPETEINNERLAEALGDSKQRDLLFVAFKLVHAGTNDNRDNFTEAELKAAEKTPIHKPLNWMHGEPNIGVIYDSKFRKASKDEAAHLEVAAAVWKYKYKDQAQEMLERHERGNLNFSMEVWYKKISCSDCNKEFEVEANMEMNFCAHLTALYAAKAAGIIPLDLKTSRGLHEICFGGGAVVDRPADSGATSLAVASNQNKGVIKNMESKTYTEDEMKALITEAIETYKAENENEKALADLKTKLSASEADIKANKDLAEKSQADLAKVTKDFDDFKASVELERTVNARIDILRAEEFEIPSDEEELVEFIEMLGSLSDENFNAFAKFQVKNSKKLAAMPTADRQKYLDNLKQKKSASPKGKIPPQFLPFVKKGKAEVGGEEEKSEASLRLPNGGSGDETDTRPAAIRSIDSFLSRTK